MSNESLNLSTEGQINDILIEHEVMWDEMCLVHGEFGLAREKYYQYLISNNFMQKEDFHIFKMVLGKRENK